MKRLIGLIFLSTLLLSLGCSKKAKVSTPAPVETPPHQEQVLEETELQSQPVEEEKVFVPAPMPEPTPMERYDADYAELPTQYQVSKGDCLWWIAEFRQIYNDPFMWPLIYKANRDAINNPDLIYPGQIFSIPRHFTMNEMTQSRKQAGAAQASMPTRDANLPTSLRNQLGWGF
ncbi:MAG: hypothetical protein CSA21_02365 [Deltaproteobacteria bacterium]|nr:MAG: hypothetical protein CSA21_02365 [Deltaproteobacteria bacterium]